MMKGKGSGIAMMYPFLTLDDNTEIVHSEMLSDGRVKVMWKSRTQRMDFIR